MNEEIDFLTPKQVALLLNVTEYTIYNYIKSGILKAYKFGKTYRINRTDFEVFIETSKYNNLNN